MNPKKEAYRLQAETVIKNLNKRNMEAVYCADKEQAAQQIIDWIEPQAIVSWGGSATLKEIGLMEQIYAGDYKLLDRDKAKSPEEKIQIQREAFSANYYLMGTNAITIDGQLINIDGNGNRVAALINGPDHVLIAVGMNKIVLDVTSGMERIRNMATPPNVLRLGKKTPCSVTGACQDCLSPDCICNQIVITRRSMHAGRIKIVLIGEELGY